jgi:hypothetical protein
MLLFLLFVKLHGLLGSALLENGLVRLDQLETRRVFLSFLFLRRRACCGRRRFQEHSALAFLRMMGAPDTRALATCVLVAPVPFGAIPGAILVDVGRSRCDAVDDPVGFRFVLIRPSCLLVLVGILFPFLEGDTFLSLATGLAMHLSF